MGQMVADGSHEFAEEGLAAQDGHRDVGRQRPSATRRQDSMCGHTPILQVSWVHVCTSKKLDLAANVARQEQQWRTLGIPAPGRLGSCSASCLDSLSACMKQCVSLLPGHT